MVVRVFFTYVVLGHHTPQAKARIEFGLRGSVGGAGGGASMDIPHGALVSRALACVDRCAVTESLVSVHADADDAVPPCGWRTLSENRPTATRRRLISDHLKASTMVPVACEIRSEVPAAHIQRTSRDLWLLPLLLALLCAGCDKGRHAFQDTKGAAANLKPFGKVHISSREVAFVVSGDGTNIDSVAFWEAPNSENTLMLVTAKGNRRVEVWKYPFEIQSGTLQHSCFGANTNVNGVVVDQQTDLLYVSVGSSRSVCVFSLPDLLFVHAFQAPADLKSEPNLGLLRLANGETRLYVSADDIVYVHNGATRELITQFIPSRGLETLVGDEFYQALYIPDEDGMTGVYSYDPNGFPYRRNGADHFGGGVFDSDAEGIFLYTCPSDGRTDNGEGLIVVADQRRPSEFEFFNRKTWEHLGVVTIEGVENTDGIASSQQSSEAYPMGLFAVVDDDSSTVGVGWEKIFRKTGFSCGPN